MKLKFFALLLLLLIVCPTTFADETTEDTYQVPEFTKVRDVPEPEFIKEETGEEKFAYDTSDDPYRSYASDPEEVEYEKSRDPSSEDSPAGEELYFKVDGPRVWRYERNN